MNEFNKSKVLVVGDIILDTYRVGEVKRVSPEAPVPIVEQKYIDDRLGGSANVALNAASLGADVALLGIVGRDENAQIIRDLLAKSKIKSFLVDSETKPTINKIRLSTASHQLMRVDIEERFSCPDIQEVKRKFINLIDDYDVIIFSDYAKGTLNEVGTLLKLCSGKSKITIVDPKGNDFKKYSGATFVTPNLKEFYGVVGKIDDEQIKDQAMKLCRDNSIGGLLITKSEKGMAFYSPNHEILELPTVAQEVFDVTGAGDTVVAVLGVCLGAGLDVIHAIKSCNRAAGIIVGKTGTSSISLGELLLSEGLLEMSGTIFNLPDLKLFVEDAKSKSKKIVMTNGCFDILHAGHVKYLSEARKLGDYLIILLNDDASITRLKGSSRPINSLENRLKILAALRVVDGVIVFSDETPEQLYATLLPDVLVKGSDYGVEEIAGAQDVIKAGNQVVLIDMVDGLSTSHLSKQIEALGI
jgi:D-beta-D-heptose 7-phosphate kinase / D-beta-D-heptose 1-phosphate adenosyltransferase